MEPDARIGPTVDAIANNFFDNTPDALAAYTIEYTDSRQAARLKKFNQWFDYLSSLKYDKQDFTIVLPHEQKQIWNSIIVRADQYESDFLSQLIMYIVQT